MAILDNSVIEASLPLCPICKRRPHIVQVGGGRKKKGWSVVCEGDTNHTVSCVGKTVEEAVGKWKRLEYEQEIRF